MDKIEEMYNVLKPIVELIEERKAVLDELAHDIEFDSHLSDKQWRVSETISSAVLELSLSGGDTAMKDLQEIVNEVE